MKKIIQPLILIISSVVLLASCRKEEEREVFLGNVEKPEFKASTVDTIPLSFETQDNLAVKFSWTNPDYYFTSGVSSQDVNYTLEIDVAGANFSGANKKAVSISKDLSVSYTQKEFNIVLSDLKLPLNVAARIEARIIASIGAAATRVESNKLAFNVRPFAPPPKVPVPTASTLWATGDAFASGWSNPLGAPYVSSQKFSKVSDTQYELEADFKAGGHFKLIQENGVWGTQYHLVTGNAYAGTFEKKDSDPGFAAPETSGRYKMVVDFQSGTFTVTKL